MIDKLNKAIQDYQATWRQFITARKDQTYFGSLKPTAVAWKTQDIAEFNTLFNELRDQCDRIVLKWMNDRWVAKMHLRQGSVGEGVTIIKLMQRRPGSADAVGLDHLDFYNPNLPTEDMLNAENIKWTHEENGNCHWVSVWFDGTEAKLRNDTVVDVTIQDLQDLNQKVLGQ